MTLLICICFCMWVACGSESNPTRPRKTVQKLAPVHELTLKNYKKLKASTKYSFVPIYISDFSDTWEKAVILGLTWGTVSPNTELLKNHDFPPNTLSFLVVFWFYPKGPYTTTDDGKSLIGRNDVVVVRVKEKPDIRK